MTKASQVLTSGMQLAPASKTASTRNSGDDAAPTAKKAPAKKATKTAAKKAPAKKATTKKAASSKSS